jgi:hypothetical protein
MEAMGRCKKKYNDKVADCNKRLFCGYTDKQGYAVSYVECTDAVFEDVARSAKKMDAKWTVLEGFAK